MPDTSSVRVELEAALRARCWDPEMLAVYADHLEAIGEPRGELISIDLRIDAAGPTPELLAYRGELLRKWFGFEPRGARHGFVDIDATSADPYAQLALLDGPASAFVRSIAIVGAPRAILDSITKLVETERPWLVKLVVRQWAEWDECTIDDEMCDKLAAAAPHLAHLEVDGRCVFAALALPALTSARLSGFDAIAGLAKRPGPRRLRTHPVAFPRLAALDFTLHAHLARIHEPKIGTDILARGLPADQLPALRELDLSRNRPGFLDPDTLGGGDDIPAMVAALPIRAQLTTLRMPAT